MNIGFIGLGVMGRPMALNLMKGGHALSLYARRPQTAAPLVEAGARVCDSPAALAACCDAVFTMVTASADVEQVVLGDDGIIHGARSGLLVIDMSTISPAVTRRIAQALAQRGVDMLDAPVSGGGGAAADGSLAIMAGGSTDTFARARPLLQCLGKTIVHIGGNGAGQIAKACNQLAFTVAIEGAAEALALARRLGADPAKVRDALLGGFAASRALDVLGPRMLNGDFVAGIEARLHHKDLHIVMDLARDIGLPLPAGGAVTAQFDALIDAYGGKIDSSALCQLLNDDHGKRS
ncbi:MAG TPA: NAD(P)-dependent oxidoreductase [Burkholderiales bacterium]|jgi:2-hydroxy-3-oxopropionate reductase|nr:NAD(P)-dependent oxidoreductase [Burkholderiales bacterium]